MLEVDRLAASYGRIQAIKGVSLQVGSGEIVTIIGANGAGKSTLMKCLAGILTAGSGRVHYDGRDITRWSPAHRVREGLVLVPEGRGILAQMSVYENLQMGAYTRSRMDFAAELEDVLKLFPPLRARLGVKASVLSGGEQQMLAIGRALLARPRLLMLDEPSLGLAPLVVRDIFRLLGELRQRGITILLVEQNARQALQTADRGYVLETGRIVMEGTADELLASEDVQCAYLGTGAERPEAPRVSGGEPRGGSG